MISNWETNQLTDWTVQGTAKFLRTKYGSNQQQLNSKFLIPLGVKLRSEGNIYSEQLLEQYRKLVKETTPFTYKEAFELPQEKAAMVFQVINVPEMVKNLGHKVLKREDIVLNGVSSYYELHTVSGETLVGEGEGDIQALKCECPSTKKTHWLWVDDHSCPLKAVASLCQYPQGLKIKSMVRQGDIFVILLDEKPDLKAPLISPNWETYSENLVAQDGTLSDDMTLGSGDTIVLEPSTNTHFIHSGNVSVVQRSSVAGMVLLKVAGKFSLTHDEHGTMELEHDGFVLKVTQQEKNPITGLYQNAYD